MNSSLGADWNGEREERAASLSEWPKGTGRQELGVTKDSLNKKCSGLGPTETGAAISSNRTVCAVLLAGMAGAIQTLASCVACQSSVPRQMPTSNT